MRYLLLFTFLITQSYTILNAKNIVKVDSICKNNELIIKLNSNNLNLTDDALQDNLGGYVDIPATKYYIKTKDSLLYIDGVVEKNKINQFISENLNDQKEKIYTLKDQEYIKFIQKIDLEENNKDTTTNNKTTTNILNIYFDKDSLQKAYKGCK